MDKLVAFAQELSADFDEEPCHLDLTAEHDWPKKVIKENERKISLQKEAWALQSKCREDINRAIKTLEIDNPNLPFPMLVKKCKLETNALKSRLHSDIYSLVIKWHDCNKPKSREIDPLDRLNTTQTKSK